LSYTQVSSARRESNPERTLIRRPGLTETTRGSVGVTKLPRRWAICESNAVRTPYPSFASLTRECAPACSMADTRRWFEDGGRGSEASPAPRGYSTWSTMPAPTVFDPSRIANRIPGSSPTGFWSSIDTSAWLPGVMTSRSPKSEIVPVTSVVPKKN